MIGIFEVLGNERLNALAGSLDHVKKNNIFLNKLTQVTDAEKLVLVNPF